MTHWKIFFPDAPELLITEYFIPSPLLRLTDSKKKKKKKVYQNWFPLPGFQLYLGKAMLGVSTVVKVTVFIWVALKQLKLSSWRAKAILE